MPASTLRALALVVLPIFLALASAVPGSAQYMYLDANGDGVNTAADVIAPTGTTTLAVWLKTDMNRDGTTAVCPSGEELTINSYEFILKATNGKMNWLTYANLQPTMTTSFGLGSSATEYHNGFGGGVILPKGTYELGTLEVSVALGTPSLTIEATSALAGTYLTEFGSQCLAQDQDNTMKLGLDWQDADGAAYGGSPQSPPVLAPIADMTVNEGAVATQTITATDADLQPLQFTKVSGPAYMTVATTDPGQGTAHATITLAPGSTSAGASTGTVRVTDGFAADEASFAITVIATNDPPVFSVASGFYLTAGTQLRPTGRVTDADGDILQVHVLTTPSYVPESLQGPVQAAGSLNFEFWIKPGVVEVGRDYLTLEATDGTDRSRIQIPIDVTGPTPLAAPPADLFATSLPSTELGGSPSSLATGDFDGDGDADLAAASEAGGLVQLCLSDSKGGLTVVSTLVSPEPSEVAAGDFDRDGLADAAFVDARSGELTMVRGVRGGTPVVSQQIAAGTRPVSLAVGDMNGDGWPDAVVLDRAGGAVAVLLNDGAGSLGPAQAFAAGSGGVALALGDFNGDSKPDVAVILDSPARVGILFNSGGGALQPAVMSPLSDTTAPLHLAAGDIDRDGLSDLAITRSIGFFTSLIVLRSVGNGAFAAPLSLGNDGGMPAFADLDRDGNLDLLTTDGMTANGIANLRYGSGTGSFSSPDAYHAAYPMSSLAVGDMNGDGAPDIVLGQNWGLISQPTDGSAALLLSTGARKFGSEWISPFLSAAGNTVLADFNADGHLDVAGGDGVNLGVGDGTFRPLLASPPNADVFQGFRIAVDINEDGRLDLLSSNDDLHAIDLRIGDGTGRFAVPTPGRLISELPGQLRFAAGDLNGDGHVDLLVGSEFYDSSGPEPLELWMGRGGGQFDPPTLLSSRAATTSLRIADVDRDGNLDIVYSDFYFSRIEMLAGHGDGTFAARRTLVVPGDWYGLFAMAWGDLNGDGLEDVVTTSGLSTSMLAASTQRADGTFSPPRPIWSPAMYVDPWLELADLDGDSNLDVITGFQGDIAVARGTGNGWMGLRRLIGPHGQRVMIGDVNEDGYPDIVSAWGFPSGVRGVRVSLNQSGRLNQRAARVFMSGAAKTIPVGATGRDLCLRLEPVGGSYENAAVDLTSIVMKSPGTGSVNQIVAIPAKKLVLGDADGNGVDEIGACFSAGDLARLFSDLKGRQDVPVVIEGRVLGSAGRIHAEVTLTIVHTGPSTAPTLAPNPLNPTGAFRFVTTRPGPARIQLFDVQGRLVRSVLDRALPAGTQEVLFDGKDAGGRSLASGVYFARVETTEGLYRMRVAIVK